MTVLGISIDVYISSATLLIDGEIIAAVAEERFTREKRSREFPLNAIKYCLEKGEIKIEDIDYIAVAWNPGVHLKLVNWRFSDSARWRAEYLYSVPNNLVSLMENKTIDHIEQVLHQKNGDRKIIYINHHLSHAANAFFLSPFQEAAILTADGFGEEETTVFATGKANKIVKIDSVIFPHSIGLLYGTITELLGFKRDSDEWKVMALASYGSRNNKYYKRLKKLVTVFPDGKFELDLTYFSYYLHDQPHSFSNKLIELFSESKDAKQPFKQHNYEIASALQQVTEEVLINILTSLHKKTKKDNLVVGGGVFMNSAFNGKIIEKTPFKKVFISSCPDDTGISIGAALYVYNHLHKKTIRNTQIHNFYGPEFKNEEIKEILQKYNIKSVYIEKIEKYTADLLVQGKIIGWFQGKMEFGQRALGNRSILADPRKNDMKEKINKAVKYREIFRPFAPAILEEFTREYFVCDNDDSSLFMEKVFPIKIEKRSKIPAVTHIDGTGRLQTVNKQTNERFFNLITEFYKQTKIPIILNTSFNLNGEPIVCTPADAIRSFYSSGLDILIMGNYVVLKEN